RKKWERCWDQVRYCSAACRRKRGRSSERRLEQAIVDLLDRRRDGASICPSEVARAVSAERGEDAGTTNPAPWRALMEPVRRAARRLAHRGVIDITQRGAVVDPTAFVGPIRLRFSADERRARVTTKRAEWSR
ncbi:MAG: DUF3253 domain-containing protein, partial [Myxococcota bacterium]